MDAIVLVSGVVYVLISISIFRSIFLQSRFWVIFLSIEYFYFIGLGLFPIANLLSYADFPEDLAVYGDLSTFHPLAYFNVIFYALGAGVGFFFLRSLRLAASHALERFAYAVDLNSAKSLRAFLLIAYVAAVLYVAFVGVERVFVGAALARGGDLDEFSGFESYLFLKRFIYFGVYAVAFLPFALTKERRPLVFVVLFVILGVFGYLAMAARYMLFQCVLVPLLFYLIYSKKINLGSLVSILVVCILGLLSVFYGKEFPSVLANYIFNNGDFEFRYSEEKFDFFRSFSHLYYSVDAGVREFGQSGPSVPKDIWLGPLGVVPSSIFASLGLSDFSYLLLDFSDRFSCINTKNISGSYATCYMPPYYIGASAYLIPLVGGFVFGAIRFFFYGVVSDCWRRMKGKEERLGLIVLIAISVEQVMLFIPNSSAFVVFLWVSIFLLRTFLILR